MARFTFRLQRVLQVREARERDARLALAAAVRGAEEARRDVEALERRLKDAERAARRLMETGPVQAWRLELYTVSIHSLRERHETARAVLADRLTEVEDRRAHLVEAMKQRKILETLKEKQRGEFLAETARQEQRLTDEVALGTTRRRRRAAGEV